MKPEKWEKLIIVHGRWSFLYFQKPLIEQDKAPLKNKPPVLWISDSLYERVIKWEQKRFENLASITYFFPYLVAILQLFFSKIYFYIVTC